MGSELKTTAAYAAFIVELKKAKDRIEKLEVALRRWQNYGCPDCGGDCGGANPPVICCIMLETRKALEGKDGP